MTDSTQAGKDMPATISKVILDFMKDTGPLVTLQSPSRLENEALLGDRIRFVAISVYIMGLYPADEKDTHSQWTDWLPNGDVFIHSGDLTMGGLRSQIIDMYNAIAALPHPVKIVIAGNHDLGLDPAYVEKYETCMAKHGITKQMCQDLRDMWISDDAKQKGIVYLEHETKEITVRGRKIKVFGSPYSVSTGWCLS